MNTLTLLREVRFLDKRVATVAVCPRTEST
ncbi:hypothetical protein DM48_7726 [Burkholderia gladioli]|uniref:Uncharacterized protein n=2 Tax=Pseudomonadota TaxID=1224 RepID=A0A6M5CFU2_PSEFL|nr:hypothetical protein DM48_7726 [Burkholderia gladioli]QJT73660.1 hypothetical protein [Pseudomonas fluorescens]